MVALLSAALWCLVARRPTPRQFGIAGVFLAFAIYGYTTARLEILLLAIRAGGRLGARDEQRLVASAGADRRGIRGARHLRACSIPVRSPGVSRLISIWSDGAPLNVVIDRFLVNYITYFSPSFLFSQRRREPAPEHGDRRDAALGHGAAADRGDRRVLAAAARTAGAVPRRRDPAAPDRGGADQQRDAARVALVGDAPVPGRARRSWARTASARRCADGSALLGAVAGCSPRGSRRRRPSSRSTSTRHTPTARRRTSTPGRSRRSSRRATLRDRTVSTCRTTSIRRTSRPSSHFCPLRRRQAVTDNATPGSRRWGCRWSPVEVVYASQPARGRRARSQRLRTSTHSRRAVGCSSPLSAGRRMRWIHPRRDPCSRPCTALAADGGPLLRLAHPTNQLEVRTMTDVVIVEAVRTPMGRGNQRNGDLRDVHPVLLAAHVLREVTSRAAIDPAMVGDVIFGCVSQTGEQAVNIARQAMLAAGFPDRGAGDDGRPAVRLVAAGDPLRGESHPVGCVRHHDRRGGREHEPRADGDAPSSRARGRRSLPSCSRSTTSCPRGCPPR